MKLNVKFQWLFWFCKISNKDFGEYFGLNKNQGLHGVLRSLNVSPDDLQQLLSLLDFPSHQH